MTSIRKRQFPDETSTLFPSKFVGPETEKVNEWEQSYASTLAVYLFGVFSLFFVYLSQGREIFWHLLGAGTRDLEHENFVWWFGVVKKHLVELSLVGAIFWPLTIFLTFPLRWWE